MSDPDESVVIEATGDNSVETIRSFLRVMSLGNEDINRIRVEIDSDEPIEVERPTVTEFDTGPPPEADEAGEPDEPEPDEPEPDEAEVEPEPVAATEAGSEAESEPEADEEPEEIINGVKVKNVPNKDPDTESFRVLETLYEHDDQHYHTNEVRSMRPNDEWDSPDSISQKLWQLAEDGLIDKQDSEENQRKNKYKITSKGKATVEANRKAE